MLDEHGRRSPFGWMLTDLNDEIFGLDMLPSWFLNNWDDFIPLGSAIDDIPVRFLDDLEMFYGTNKNWSPSGLTDAGYLQLQEIRKKITHDY